MRKRVIETLAFARDMVRDNIELQECRHYGNFDEYDPACHTCEFEAECQWLYHNDEFVALERRPDEELTAALEFAIGYVDAHVTRWGHPPAVCACETCRWLRGAQSLFDEAANHAWNGDG